VHAPRSGWVGESRRNPGRREDPNIVVITETTTTREIFETLMSDPAVQAEIVADDVDPASVQVDFLDEVTAEGR
jgi:hypothetical protein